MTENWQAKALRKARKKSDDCARIYDLTVALLNKYKLSIDDILDGKCDWSKWTRSDIRKWRETSYGYLAPTL